MRILSLNVWGGCLHAPLIDYLAEVDADVFCLQEVVRDPASLQSEWSVYRDHGTELGQRTNLFEEIRSVLPGHDGFFSPNARGDLFVGERQVATEFGLATFVRRSLPVIGQAMGFVHGTFSADGFGRHPRPRNAHCIRLYDDSADAPVTVCQLHGLRELGGKGETPARQAQAQALVALIRSIWKEGERLVVCGDFNVLPESATFGILAELGLSDLVTGRGFTDTRTSHYGKDVRFADYMLTTPRVTVAGFDVVAAPEVSDHRALLLDIL